MAIIINSGKNPGDNNHNNENELSLITDAPRKVIIGQIDHHEYGIFGRCYSQPKYFVDLLCEQTSSTIYYFNTLEHELGQWTVDIILCALNVLPEIKAWQTPNNSAADVSWKWDLIIEHEGYLYPVQIKSSLDAIKECKEKFHETLGIEAENIFDRKDNIVEKYQKAIESYMKCNKLTSRKDANIVAKLKKRDQEIQELNKIFEDYKKANPLYIWAARDEDTIKALVRIFVKLFSVSGNVLDLEAQAMKQYRNKYKNIKEILLEEETEKYNTVKEFVSLVKQYLILTNNFLKANDLININNNKPTRLEDILSLKKNNELLDLAETMMAYYNKSLSITQDINDDRMVTYDNKLTINYYKIKLKEKVLQNIQGRKHRRASVLHRKVTRSARKYQNYDSDIENTLGSRASQEEKIIRNSNLKYIEPEIFIKCLEKLIIFDAKSSQSKPELLAEIKNKITYIASKEVALKTKTIPKIDDLNSIVSYF